MKNMQKFPLCRGLWKKKSSRSNSRLKLYKHTAKRTDTKLGKNYKAVEKRGKAIIPELKKMSLNERHQIVPMFSFLKNTYGK